MCHARNEKLHAINQVGRMHPTKLAQWTKSEWKAR